MDYLSLINKYYPTDNEQKRILLAHSKSVAQKALQIADLHPELNLDRQFLLEASMIHDIGIFACDAAGIHCFGTEPYIRHGVIGADLLREAGYLRHALVCERHTGTGLPLHHIEMLGLPLPTDRNMCPETEEEKVICYADKFYSKTHLDHCCTIDEAYKKLLRHGHDTAERFRLWSQKYE